MKNVIFLVCDGLSYDITVDNQFRKSPMKFLQELRKKSINCQKAFSQAPYTEAGIMGLMYGRNPLDRGAYLLGMQEWDNSTYKSFYEAGYDLYASYFGSHIPPELMEKGHYIYTENYFSPMFSRYIRGKLDYYRSVLEKDELDIKDVKALVRLLDRHFDTMMMWHSPLADENDCTGAYQMCIAVDGERRKYISEWKKKVSEQYADFKNAPEEYVKSVLSEYGSHFITNECDVVGLQLNDDIIEQRKWVASKYAKLFRKVKQKNKKYFIKNNQFPFGAICDSLKVGKKRFLEHVYRTYQAYGVLDESKMTSLDLPQICSSSRAFVRSFIKWNESREDEAPFFTYLHFDEFHRPISFYSQDILDRKLVENEMQVADYYINSLPKNYKGNVGFDLAAQYLDSCIKEMYDYLESKDLLKNTLLIVTADHGSSNFGGDVRFTVTNNFYPEQYHIPVLVYNGGQHTDVEGFINIKDIPATILDLCGIECPKTFTGKSFLSESGTNTFVEYLGTGVPDLLRRPVYYQYRDNEKAYLLTGKLFDDSHKIDMLEYFDLKRDPRQLKNIVDKISEKDKEKCIGLWKDRYLELKADYEHWCVEV